MKIGYRIKDLRIRQRVTLKGLAKKTGLTASFFSQLERDLVSPSISSLEKIAQALGTKVGYFFEGDKQKELVFVKRDTGKKFFDKKRKMSCETLASGLLNIKMQPQVFTLGIGATLTDELNYPGAEKFGILFKGKIAFHCGKERLVFERGDSIYCARTQRLNKATNIGATEAKLVWIILTLS